MRATRTIAIVGAGLMLIAVLAIIVGITRQSDEAGMGVPTSNLVTIPESEQKPLDSFEGEIEVASNGCFHLETADERFFVVWPKGTRQDSAVVITSDGVRRGGGDSLEGGGWIRTVSEVVAAADGQDGYMDMVTGYCADEGERVAVLDFITT